MNLKLKISNKNSKYHNPKPESSSKAQIESRRLSNTCGAYEMADQDKDQAEVEGKKKLRAKIFYFF